VTWTPRLRIWMRRIDHAGVHLLIAGTYTPICLLVLDGAWRLVLLAIVWVGAAAAIVLKLVWVAAPKWLAAVLGIALGWVGVAVLPQLATLWGKEIRFGWRLEWLFRCGDAGVRGTGSLPRGIRRVVGADAAAVSGGFDVAF